MKLLVNGEQIHPQWIREEMHRLRPHLEIRQESENLAPDELNARLEKWAQETVIERVLIRQAAIRQVGDVPPEVLQRGIEKFRAARTHATQTAPLDESVVHAEVESRMKTLRLIQQIADHAPVPSEEEILHDYEANRETFRQAGKVHASHVVCHVHSPDDESSARATIERAHAELLAGAAFEDVVRQFSDCPSQGGAIEPFRPGEMVAEFERVLFALKPGEISGIFRTVFGFHIARLHSEQPTETAPLEQVRAAIVARLRAQVGERAIEAYIDELRAKADIRIDEDEPTQAVGAVA